MLDVVREPSAVVIMISVFVSPSSVVVFEFSLYTVIVPLGDVIVAVDSVLVVMFGVVSIII